MAPTAQEHGDTRQRPELSRGEVPPTDGDRIVISGMAGLYPQSQYVKDLENILYNKVNPVSFEDVRWKYNHPEVLQCTGKVPELDRFDAQFFKVQFRQGNCIDPMGRKLLEQAFLAIYDSGINPNQLSGKKVGVFIGTSISESEKVAFYDTVGRTGLGIIGCSKSMFANRISYWLNAKGPSLNFDAACCSSTVALEQACQSIARGECESAIVGGANLCLHPQSMVHYGRHIPLAADGKARCFDQHAAGTALSEAINVIYLQKAKDALRIYGDIIHAKCEFSVLNNHDDSLMKGFCCEPSVYAKFLRSFYLEAGVPPSLVDYVEAFGAANLDTDKAELEIIDNIFCKDRKEPLLVGSVASNIGYCGAASGISAVTKVLLGYHKGKLAGNLHYETPRSDVAGVREGRIQVIGDHWPFGSTYAAINTLSMTGVNGHILLQGQTKPNKINYNIKSNIPRLVNVSGRQESAVTQAFENLKSQPIHPEQLALLHNIHETKISGHLGRGFIILDTNNEEKTISLSEKADYYDDVQRPLWFVYSGMGSQWAGMGAQLMRIPIFAAAIERCHQALSPKGIDIVKIITSTDKSIFDNILHPFVGIAAVQIGLTDVLMELGLIPDKIIGHSVGELGCAYADGCLTAEEMILSAYSRGLVSSETTFVRGSMAAVGAGYNNISKICPPEIEIACHNGPDSCTISGPADAMRDFVGTLTAKKIFAKEVPCSNIAFHSRYIVDAGPGLLKYLEEIIKTPKLRSPRWVSTSVPQVKWEEAIAKYSSAEYHTNNLLSPVLFEESSKLIPNNAVLVEVAPHGLLQAILKRSLPESCINIPLTRRGHTDNALMLLDAIGKLYIHGYNPKVRVLYPKVDFPVSVGTPFLSHLVEWMHDEKWNLASYFTAERKIASASEIIISVYDDEHDYLKGHVIGKKTLLPFSFALVAVWDTLAMSMNIEKKKMNVEFNNVQFYTQPILYEHRNNKLTVSLHKGTGQFEVMNENSRVATGYIRKSELRNRFSVSIKTKEKTLDLRTEDVYKLLNERDYSYNGQFRSIESANVTLSEANLKWSKNWVTLIDGIIQLNTLRQRYSSLSKLDRISRISINVGDHINSIENRKEGTAVLKTCIDDIQNYTRCGAGIVFENIEFVDLPPINENTVTLKTRKFVPRFSSDIDVYSSLQVIIQIVAENIHKDVINVIGITDHYAESGIIQEIKKCMNDNNIPGIQIRYKQIYQDTDELLGDADLVVVQNLANDDKRCQNLHRTLQSNTFVVNEVPLDGISRTRPLALYSIISVLKSKDQNTGLELLRWRPTSTTSTKSITTISVRSDSDIPVLTTARNKLAPEDALVVLSSNPPIKRLKDTIKQWQTDVSRNNIFLVMSKEIGLLEELPDITLAYNIFDEGMWGGEYYLPSREIQAEKERKILKCGQLGNFSSLQWTHAPKLTSNGVLVEVHYAGLHVNDVKNAAGAVSFKNMESCGGSHSGYGMEFSGLTESGERVMGLVQTDAASSHVLAKPELLWPVPSYWTLEDAATVPFAYIYAYYCLNVKIDLQLIEEHVTQFNILVHGGAGAMGQAIINIALAKGYKVFTTVSDSQKKRFLLRVFPQLNEGDIGNSRDASFGDKIMTATEGKGCNIVFCCLQGELKNISLNCCSSFGITFDTVLINNKEDYHFGMNYLTKERTYIPVDFSSIFMHLKSENVMTLQTLLSDGIARGYVRPLSRVTFAPHEAPRAFRLLAASRHRGRVLLRVRDSLSSSTSQLRLSCAQNVCHLIFCDQQHLGLQLADTLITRGANKIHIHIADVDIHLRYRLSWWEKLNVEVSVSSETLKNDNEISYLLHKVSKSGLDGIFVFADNSMKNTLISDLDSVTRKLNLALKKLVVVSEDGTVGQDTCIARARDGLPATMLDLSMLKTFCKNDSSWYSKAMEATCLALHTADPVLVAHAHSHQTPLLEQIADLADVKITDETSSSTTLEALGMDPGKSQTIGAFLSNIYHISPFEENIPLLTIAQIKQIQDRTTGTDLQEVNGLGKFYTHVNPDELMATTEMVLLPTVVNKYTMIDDELDMKKSFLCIIPGLEGDHERFRTLCKRLKLPAFVLQPGLDHLDETPQELARRYAEILLTRTRNKERFNLLGYETGVMAALELAAILEKHGRTGTVFCLGDGPEEMKDLLEAEALTFGSEEALQEGVVKHMVGLMADDAAMAEESTLQGYASWRARVDASVRALLGRVSHSAQYTRALLQAAYARICTARRYRAEPRALRSRLVLLRARRVPASTEECSLQRYSQQPLIVRDLNVPLAHVTADLRVPTIINKYLDTEILEAFEKLNLCDSYLVDADSQLSIKSPDKN